MKNIVRYIYYGLACHITFSSFSGYKLWYFLRREFIKSLLRNSDEHIIAKSKCYIGSGARLSVGDRSQLGQNARLNGTITIGKLMGPDVVMMATSHAFTNIDIAMNQQGEAVESPIQIGDDV